MTSERKTMASAWLTPPELPNESTTLTEESRLASGLWPSLSAPLRAMLPSLAEGALAAGVFDRLPVLVLVRDPNGKVVLFNRIWTEWTGHTADETAGHDWFEQFVPIHERVAARRSFEGALNGGGGVGRINAVLTRDGSERKIQWWDRPLLDTQGKVSGLVSVGIDFSVPIVGQVRLIEEQRLAAVSEMMNGLAHESRNALQRSQACLEVLGLKLRDRPDLTGLVERIQRAHDHLHQLYEEVRVYAAPLSLKYSSFDARSALTEAWERLPALHAAEAARAQLEIVPNDQPFMIQADRAGLRQLFFNILENSLCATDQPSIIRVSWHESWFDGRSAWSVRVQDNGPGFSDEARLRVFEPFFTTKTQGTGLGMATVRRLVEAHGGTIAVVDSIEPGATLVLTLPKVPS